MARRLPRAAQIPTAEFAARRDALAEALPDGVFLALGAPAPVPDFLPFHQDPYLFYLTGFDEPGAALILVK
ncbi:MAG: aminopeptidase P N-terminal domain-containing protein, partial [Gemmatimonadota bacterium]